jgi:hypothetical protein
MHRSLCALLLLIGTAAAPLHAQGGGPTGKGSVLVGGTASIARSTVEFEGEESTSTGISVSPNLLFFVAPRLAIGGRLALSWVNFDDGDANSWLVGPAAQFYFAGGEAKTLPFVGLSLGIGGSSAESDVVSAELESDVWSLEGTAGLTWMVSRQVGITGELFVERANIENTTGIASIEQTRTTMGLRFGFSAFLFR